MSHAVRLAVLAVTAGCSASISSFETAASLADQPIADRIGVYAWNFDRDAAGQEAPLHWAANRVAGVGSHTMRVAFGAGPGQRLVEAIRAPELAPVLGHPGLHTIMLTAFTARMDFAQTDRGIYADEAADVEELMTYLATAYPDKRFVIGHWEGDWSTMLCPPDPQTGLCARWLEGAPETYARMTQWINARARGVRAARDATGAGDRLASMLEFNVMHSLNYTSTAAARAAGELCSATYRCVVSAVAPYADVDLYSYSSWQAINQREIREHLDEALANVRRGRPDVTPDQFMLGELGTPRDISGDHAATRAVADTIGHALDWGVGYAVLWQVADHQCYGGWGGCDDVGIAYGAYRYDGQLSHTGEWVRDSIVNGAPLSPPALSPEPVIAAVQDGGTASPAIRPDSILALYGSFAPRGRNQVHIFHDTDPGRTEDRVRWDLDGSTPYTCGAAVADPALQQYCWYESDDGTQINVGLPPGAVVDRPVYIQLTRDGVDGPRRRIDLTASSIRAPRSRPR